MRPPLFIENYIFDLDGTLIDSLPGIDAAAQAAIAECEYDHSPPTFRPFIGPPIRKMFQNALQIKNDENLDRLVRSFRANYDTESWKLTQLYPQVLQTLEQLTAWGSQLYIITNKPAIPTAKILNHLGLSSFFQEVISPESRNPSFANKTEATLNFQARLQIPSHESILIGDRLDDAVAATAAGFFFCLAKWGYGSPHQEIPSVGLELNQFSEILEICPN